MKKSILLLVVAVTVLMMVSPLVLADEVVILESPDAKIIIDGKIGVYEDVPIIIDERTLLPFRAVLVNLGVTDDDEHIIWNEEDSSVTVKKEMDGVVRTIYLQIGNTTAFVDGAEETLDVPAILYNSRTYIPARFISQALGKKVVWDGSFNAVLIKDEEDFNSVKDLLDKMDEVMKPINKYTLTGNMDMAMSMGDLGTSNTKTSLDASVDYDKKIMYMDMEMDMSDIEDTPEGIQNVSAEYYYADNAMYMLMNLPNMEAEEELSGQWMKTSLPQDLFDIMFENNDNLKLFEDINLNDTIAAGLVISDSDDDSTIKLSGNVYMERILEQTQELQNIPEMEGITYNIKSMYIEMKIDKETYLPINTRTIMEMSIGIEGMEINYSADSSLDYNFDKDFELALPTELENAVEISELEASMDIQEKNEDGEEIDEASDGQKLED
jgi:hypothetical protein